MISDDSFRALQVALNYRFARRELLTLALTHRSAGSHNNERLEFLGDAVLSTVISADLFDRHPGLEEGSLTRLRASLVNQATLADLARRLDLGRHLQLGAGELKSGGERRDSILADALEALFGAVYLDGGFEAARRAILDLYATRLTETPPPDHLKDAKTRLQEYLQARGLPLPVYAVVAVSGAAHHQHFKVSCSIAALSVDVTGEAGSRRSAEQAAAEIALERL